MQSYIEQTPYYCQQFSMPRPYRLYHCQPEAESWKALQGLCSQIDLQAADKICHFHREQDKINTLLGRLLLRQAIRDMNLSANIKELSYGPQGKPQVPGLHFSLAHCDDLLVLACSAEAELGVDCEAIIGQELHDYRTYFSIAEWQSICQDNNPLNRFYQLWTRKESLLKALGCGLQDSLADLDVQNDVHKEQDRLWQFVELHISPTHIAHLCLEL